jgi:hypothetical protein
MQLMFLSVHTFVATTTEALPSLAVLLPDRIVLDRIVIFSRPDYQCRMLNTTDRISQLG